MRQDVRTGAREWSSHPLAPVAGQRGFLRRFVVVRFVGVVVTPVLALPIVLFDLRAPAVFAFAAFAALRSATLRWRSADSALRAS